VLCRREGNRRAAQRLRARRVATVAELKEHILALESEKQAFMDDLSQLATSCQLVVEENQWLRSRLELLEKRKLDKASACLSNSKITWSPN
jgi:Basic region leucine zipper